LLTLLVATTLSLASAALYAHEDAPQLAQHSGVVSEATSGNTAELSLEGGMLMVYLRNHDGAPIASKDSSGELTLLSAGKKQVVTLLPSGANALMAKDTYQVAAGSKAVLKLTLPGKAAEQFRFALK
jgi:hypothetical protein